MSIEAAAWFSGKTVDELRAMDANQADWQQVFDAEFERLAGIYSCADAALIAEYFTNHKTGRRRYDD